MKTRLLCGLLLSILVLNFHSPARAGASVTPPLHAKVNGKPFACPTYTATLSGDQTICDGDIAELPIEVTDGVEPFTIIYDDGNGPIQLDNQFLPLSISVTPSTTTTY